MNIAIVLIGYNRIDSIRRSVSQMLRADYSRARIDLYFSIDKSSEQEKIKSFCDAVEWPFGGKIVRAYKYNQGLRNHVLACGDLTEIYDAVVILEDDIVVSDCFIDYVVAALDFVKDDDGVAGISLYAPSINEMAMLPFSPKRTGFDNYYLQSAQSWGQCWTRRMWQDFRSWYEDNSDIIKPGNDMPSRIYSWPETSWKKYFMKYLVDTGRTFFYPYDSHSSNYSDVGQHNKVVTPHFQVPLISDKKEFRFGRVDEVPCYDVFFERIGLNYEGKPLCLDLYGTRTQSNSRFLLTHKELGVPKIESFGLTYRPQEDNFVKSAPGNDIYLYDMGSQPNLWMKEESASFKLANYHTNLGWRHSLIYSTRTLISRIFNKIWRK